MMLIPDWNELGARAPIMSEPSAVLPGTRGAWLPRDESCDTRQKQDNRREGCRSGPSDSYHDLPELTALLEIAVHICHLIEGEDAIDDGFERARLQTVEDELDRCLSAGLVSTC